MKNIKRIDTGNTHGWQVCIQREGEEYTKLYSDKKYGGRDKAREKARVHRDEKLEEMPDLPGDPEEPSGHLHTPEMRHRIWRDKLTQTGVKGLGFRWFKSNENYYPRVTAMYQTENGKRVQRARSISKHGLESAVWQIAQELYEGRGETGPEPEELFEEALPAIEKLVEQDPVQPRVHE